MKHKEIDAEFFIKKKEFDDLHNKLWLNKVLAEAFRSKCMENKSSSRSGMLQGEFLLVHNFLNFICSGL